MTTLGAFYVLVLPPIWNIWGSLPPSGRIFELFLNPMTYEYSPLKFKLTIQARPQPASTFIHGESIRFVPDAKGHLPLLPLCM